MPTKLNHKYGVLKVLSLNRSEGITMPVAATKASLKKSSLIGSSFVVGTSNVFFAVMNCVPINVRKLKKLNQILISAFIFCSTYSRSTS